jgi:hypothetical protein
VYAWSDVLRLCDDWLGLDSGKAFNPEAFPIDVVNARLLAI